MSKRATCRNCLSRQTTTRVYCHNCGKTTPFPSPDYPDLRAQNATLQKALRSCYELIRNVTSSTSSQGQKE